jgi:Thiamine pyrophosphate enzyme, N-terminal TPP binding domain
MTRPNPEHSRSDDAGNSAVVAPDVRNWPNLVFQKLREFGIRHVTYVPDSGHARLIELCQAAADMAPTVLTTEEEGIGILAGAWLGGERGVLLMHSSGVGNCVNNAVARQGVRLPLADDRHHAWRVGGSQSLAGPDGPDCRQ